MNNKKAFTLIEMIISITIVVILTMMTFAPYSYYQNKTKLKVTTREISQIILDWKNMAMNWAVWELWNVSIWVYFDTSASEKWSVKVFSYPYDIDSLDISNIPDGDIKLLKTLNLQKWVEIDEVTWKENMIFFFDAISWDLSCYSWNGSTRTKIEEDIMTIDFSYKNATSNNLKRTIKYFTSTNIIDY